MVDAAAIDFVVVASFFVAASDVVVAVLVPAGALVAVVALS